MRITLLALVLACGCGASTRAKTWHELATEHFRIASDIEPPALNVEAARLETALAALTTLTGAERRLAARIDVVWLADEVEVERLVPHSDGYFLPRQPGVASSPPLIVVGGRSGRQAEERFMHELAHLVTIDRIKDAPPWVTEGLASWYGHLDLDRGTVGLTRDEASQDYMRARVNVPFEQVVRADEDRFHSWTASWLYDGARLLVGTLLGDDDLRRRFVDYLARLGRGENAQQAWDATLAPVRDAIERAFDAANPTLPQPIHVVRWSGATTMTTLTPAMVERWMARARPWSSRDALLSAGAALARAAADDSAERHYWSGVYAARWRRWREAEAELLAAMARAPSLGPARRALDEVEAQLARVPGAADHALPSGR